MPNPGRHEKQVAFGKMRLFVSATKGAAPFRDDVNLIARVGRLLVEPDRAIETHVKGGLLNKAGIIGIGRQMAVNRIRNGVLFHARPSSPIGLACLLHPGV
jgi:hypothetical protein